MQESKNNIADVVSPTNSPMREPRIVYTPTRYLRASTPIKYIQSPISRDFDDIEDDIPNPVAHQINRQDTLQRDQIKNHIQNSYQCCGTDFDKRILNYAAKLLVSIILICFCIYRLSTSCENGDNLWVVGLLSSICGGYIGGIVDFQAKK